MKKLFYALIVLGTTLVTVAACSDDDNNNAREKALRVEIVQDTKCNVIWVDVEGFSSQTDVPLGKGLYTRENAEEIMKLDAWFNIELRGTNGSEKIDVSGGWEKQNGNYFFTVDTLEWNDDFNLQGGLRKIIWDAPLSDPPGEGEEESGPVDEVFITGPLIISGDITIS